MEVRSTIQLVFAEHKRRYGYRRVSKELRRRGMLVNQKRVQRLMREDNQLAVQPKAFVITTDSDHDLEVYLNLASRMKLTGINQLWVADITYIRLHREFVFLAVILDAFSRKVVGLVTGSNAGGAPADCGAREGHRGTEAATWRGASFRPWRPVRIRCLRCGAAQTRHDPKHEPACESVRQRQLREFHEDSEAGGNLEEIYANEYRDLDHLRANIAEFFDSYYNRVRLHSALGYKTPEFGVPIAVCLNRRGHPTKLSHNCAKTLLYWTTTEAKPFRSLLACRLIFPKPRASSATSSASTS
jgi:putative transposase